MSFQSNISPYFIYFLFLICFLTVVFPFTKARRIRDAAPQKKMKKIEIFLERKWLVLLCPGLVFSFHPVEMR
jgi:hypothetical protein